MNEMNGEVSLDALLDCLPLVYNPTTKSLQLGSINHNISKFTLSNGGIQNGSDQSTESQNIPNKSKSTEDICHDRNEEVKSCCTLSREHSQISGHDSTDNVYSLNSSNTDLSLCTSAGSESCLAINESDSKSSIPKTKGGISFLIDLWTRKNHEQSNTSDSTVNKSVDESNSCYSWKLFSRSNGNTKNTKSEDLLAGSIGLIMGKRPSNVPAKNLKEEERHRKQHNEIVSAFKKKEMKQAKEKRKEKFIQLKHEQQLTEAVSIWKNEIIPHWQSMYNNKRTLDLWWHGIPSCVRGSIWKLTIGNELNMSPLLFQILIKRSEEQLTLLDSKRVYDSLSDSCAKSILTAADHEATIEFIKLDVSRTFPQLGIFQKGGPMHDTVHDILSAFVCYRPDVGYVQGMSFLAAMLLLNLPEEEAFVAFSNLVCRPPHLHFFTIDQLSMKAYYTTFSDMLAESMPALFTHFSDLNVTPDMYLMDWILSLFSRSLPLDVASRLWDVYLRDGEIFIFQAALGILKLYEVTLLAQECTVSCAQFLTRLRDDLDSDELFKAIAIVRTTICEGFFEQRLLRNLEQYRQSSHVLQ